MKENSHEWDVRKTYQNEIDRLSKINAKLIAYIEILSGREDYEYPFSTYEDDILLPTQVLKEIGHE